MDCRTLLTLVLALAGPAYAADSAGAPATAKGNSLPHPILYVTQYPVPYDFAAIGSVFASQNGGMQSAGRGGDLWIRYPDGSRRNLTQEAGFGMTGLQGENAISVRDPAVHWLGTKAVFAMVTGAPTQQYQVRSFRWQLYEATGLGVGETVAITKVANQPADYNNIQPAYDSAGRIVFVCDRPRNGAAHLYPQHDEYESTATPTGLWRLDPSNGELVLLQHAPSGSFTPFVDSYGRILFTRWDHLQRDQQNDSPTNASGNFNYSSEAVDSVATTDRSEVFPEPRAGPATNVNLFTINHFFPWQLNQDGTAEETLNHVGRHELHGYFERSFKDDAALLTFNGPGPGVNPNSIQNLLQLSEDPTQPGRYVAIDAPEFFTHAGGQLVRFSAPPSLNAAQFAIEYLTPRSTSSFYDPGEVPASFTGHYRNPRVLSDGQVIAAHTSYAHVTANLGTRAAPSTGYQYRLKRLAVDGSTFHVPVETLTPGTSKAISFWDPDVLVSYDGPLWELSPVEVRARTVPPATVATLSAPELQAFALEGVDPQAFQADLAARGLAVAVIRDTTSRDRADKQQPYNLRVPGGVQHAGNNGKIYDIVHFQFLQGDQIRGIGKTNASSTPRAGRRVLAQPMHDEAAMSLNPDNAAGPPGSVPIFSDGSVAAFVPAARAMTWQATAADGTPVVRERYWLSLQRGEVRTCDGCHGVNEKNQAGQDPSQSVPLALRDLLARWSEAQGMLFADGFD